MSRGAVRRLASQEAVSAIRVKAELARRLSGETRDPAAKAGMLELAALLEADAAKLENALQGVDRLEVTRPKGATPQ